MTGRYPVAAVPDRPELEVSVAGTPLDELQHRDVAELDVAEEVGRHARLTLLVQNWDPDQRAVRHSDGNLFAPGSEIELRLGYHSSLESVFKGVITALGTHFTATSVPTLRVEARSKSALLAHPARSRVFESTTDGDVVQAIAADYSLSADAETGVTQDFVVIDDRPDWQYLTERAAALGWVTYVRGDSLVFRPPAELPQERPELTWGRNLTELHLTQDVAAVADPVTATGWDPEAQEAADGQSGAGSVSVPSGSRPTVDQAVGDTGWALRERIVPAATPLAVEELEQLAAGRATLDGLAHVSGRGSTIGLPALRCNSWVEVAGAGQRLSGPYYVSAVRHRLSGRGFVTEFQVGLPRPLRPPAPPPVAGLRIGVVEDLDDPQQWGRVKVGSPWRTDAPDAVWARLSTLDAGPSQGTWFVPDVGQEVVVGLIGGDERHPVVLGALWNGQQSPPETIDPEENAIRAIVTRSGHKIRFDDADDGKLEITTAGGRIVVLSDADGGEIDLAHSDGGNHVTISGDGILVEATSGDITLSATAGNVVVDASGLQASTTGSATLESSTSLEVTAGARLALAGALVEIG